MAEVIDSRTFYGLPKKKNVVFEDLLECEEDVFVDISDKPSTSGENCYDVGNSSEEEFEDLLVSISDNEDDSEVDSEEDIPLQVLKKRIQDKKDDKWLVKDSARGPAVLPVFKSDCIIIESKTILNFFTSFISEDMIEDIVYQSNLYASQKGKTLNLTKKELYVFLGITIVMSYIRYPRIRLYWSSEDGLRMDLIADAMSINRYEVILRHLHFIENPMHSNRKRDHNPDDKLWKLRPFLNKLQANFLSSSTSEECQSIDEQVIPMKSRISIKQYLPKKPKKWGIKCWVRAGVSGYMHQFEIYQGAKCRLPVSKLGACSDVVLRLCEGIHNKNHKVFFDNLFCSVSLLETLYELKIYATGTLRKNRMQGADKVLPSDKEMMKQPRGTSYVVTKKNVTITKWYDRAPMLVASTCAGKEPQDKAKRFSKSSKAMIEIDRPFSIKFYNKNMGGVDLHDQYLAMYPMRRKNKRWYIKVFMHFLDVAIVNGFILYKMQGNSDKDFLQFKGSIARTLINKGFKAAVGRPRSATPPSVLKKKPAKRAAAEVRFNGTAHWPVLTDVKNANWCKSNICKRRTKYICKSCKEYICPGCFEHFHTPT